MRKTPHAARMLLDTVFIQALLNARNKYHAAARALLPRVKAAERVWVTEAVFLEVAAALSAVNRAGAAAFIRQCYQTANITVVSTDTPLLNRALDLYAARADKTWSLTDCLSFVVMQDEGVTEALTADHHFAQAGFLPLITP